MKRMEDEEHGKSSFLKDGLTDCLTGKLERQSTIRIWSEAELLCRELAIETISQSKIIGSPAWRKNLEPKLWTNISKKTRQEE